MEFEYCPTKEEIEKFKEADENLTNVLTSERSKAKSKEILDKLNKSWR